MGVHHIPLREMVYTQVHTKRWYHRDEARKNRPSDQTTTKVDMDPHYTLTKDSKRQMMDKNLLVKYSLKVVVW